MQYQVAFYKSRHRLFNRLVAWYLRGSYSHCELILATNGTTATCASASYMDGGVRIKTMHLDPAHWDIVSVESDALPETWLSAHKGESYDVLGLLGFVWRRQTGNQRKWFCSEAVAAMLGLREPWRFDPMTLWAAQAEMVSSSSGSTIDQPGDHV